MHENILWNISAASFIVSVFQRINKVLILHYVWTCLYSMVMSVGHFYYFANINNVFIIVLRYSDNVEYFLLVPLERKKEQTSRCRTKLFYYNFFIPSKSEQGFLSMLDLLFCLLNDKNIYKDIFNFLDAKNKYILIFPQSVPFWKSRIYKYNWYTGS